MKIDNQKLEILGVGLLALSLIILALVAGYNIRGAIDRIEIQKDNMVVIHHCKGG